jgi:hypothetical protein
MVKNQVLYKAPTPMGNNVDTGDIITVDLIAGEPRDGISLLLARGGRGECSALFFGKYQHTKGYYVDVVDVSGGSAFVNINNSFGLKFVELASNKGN